MTLKNTFYQAKRNFFKYIAFPSLAIMASCALNKEFVEDDLYYSPKDDFQKIEIAQIDSLENQGIKVDTLEIKTIQDLNYAVRNGADATLYWENYFIYSPYRSSLGWDFDGDGIVNAFDIHPYNYDLFDDINNNGISDVLEFSFFFPTNLDFIYWNLYYSYPSWRYPYYNYSSWNHHWNTHNYYFEYDKDWIKPRSQRRRTLATMVGTQTETGVKRSDEINVVKQKSQERTNNRISTSTNPQKYERPKTQERTNTNYQPRTTRETRNTYSPRTNTKTQNTQTTRTSTRQSTTTRPSSSTVRSSSGNSNSSGSSTRSSGSSSGSSNSSSSKRDGRR